MTKVLILGSTGMLGNTVSKYFQNKTTYTTDNTSRIKSEKTFFFDAHTFLSDQKKFSFLRSYDFIINCIGVIKPYCKDDDMPGVRNAIEINALFPHVLQKFVHPSQKIIHVTTDCVYDGMTGNYREDALHNPLDAYGKTKSLGEVQAENVINIRCSIIGPEQFHKVNLLEWFLSQNDGSTIQGFEHHLWNGVTTLQYAELCARIIETDSFSIIRSAHHTHHFIPNNEVTKYELLSILKAEYKKRITIQKVYDDSHIVNRILSSNYHSLDQIFPKTTLKKAIKKLSQFYSQNG